MAGTWGAQEYYGAKPGNQTGSILVSDGRDIRQPLPSAGCAGGNSGPIRFGHGGQATGGGEGWSIVGPGGLATGPAVIPAGPWPLKANNWAFRQDGKRVWVGEGDPPAGNEEFEQSHDQGSGTTNGQAGWPGAHIIDTPSPGGSRGRRGKRPPFNSTPHPCHKLTLRYFGTSLPISKYCSKMDQSVEGGSQRAPAQQ